ncbi:hypothetical protein HY469_03630 [Candidatus Roizmanbacteria bacterium]|nr:hypothetical protein [Candidatus Roizmanbacteria bacterium]
MNYSRYITKIFKFIRANYIISVFIAIVLFTLFIASFKVLSTEDEYIYAKIKVSQGYWWVDVPRPRRWLAQSIQLGEKEKTLSGKPIAEIHSVRYYPYWGPDQYEIYLTVLLRVSTNEETGKYTFKRSSLGISSPVDFEFPSTFISGTVMDLSPEPFSDAYIDKVVTLEKKFAFLWEYDAIQIGDTYFDGEETVVEILDKKTMNSYSVYSGLGNNYPVESEPTQTIVVTARVKVQEKDGEYIFGEEQVLRAGKTMNIVTSQFVFDQYTVSSIE